MGNRAIDNTGIIRSISIYILFLLIITAALIMPVSAVTPQYTTEYIKSSQSWIPNGTIGLNQVQVHIVGGGGYGGNGAIGYYSGGCGRPGGGGGAGTDVSQTVTISSGTSYPITVGGTTVASTAFGYTASAGSAGYTPSNGVEGACGVAGGTGSTGGTYDGLGGTAASGTCGACGSKDPVGVGGSGYGAGGGGGALADSPYPIGYGGAGTSGIVSLTYLTPVYSAFSTTGTLDGLSPLTITFNDTSTGYNLTSWNWTFRNTVGNNTVVEFSTSKNTTYTFGVGVWDVRHSVTSDGLYANTSSQFLIYSAPAPISEFTSNVTKGIYPLGVSFTDTSNLSYGPKTRYWEFEGGVPLNSTDYMPNVSFAAIGVYNVTLNSSYDAFSGSNTTKFIGYINVTDYSTKAWNKSEYNVGETARIGYEISNEYWHPAGSPDSGGYTYTYTVAVYDSTVPSVLKSNQAITSQSGSVNLILDRATYTPGYYYAYVLRTKIGAGEAATAVGGYATTILIAVAPTANFTATNTTGAYPLVVQYTDTSSGYPTIWDWYLGEGTNSTTQNPSYIYYTKGLYNVTLNATNANSTSIKSVSNYINVTEPATVQWSSSVYSLGDTGIVSYIIDDFYWAPASYTYNIVIYDVAATPTLKSTKTISTQTGSESFVFDSTNYPIGYYYAYVQRTKIAPGETAVQIGSAQTQISGIVRVYGYVKDALNGSTINANVSVVQGSLVKNQIASSGAYDTSPTAFLTNVSMNLNVTNSGYYQYLYSLTAATTKAISLNITLVPTTVTGASIGGIVEELPYGLPIPGATVSVVNGTHTLTNVSNTNGYYFIDGLAPGTSYTVTSTKTGYTGSTNSATAGTGYTNQNSLMNTTYSFTGQFVDSSSGAIIAKVTVSDTTGYSTTTTAGTFTNTYPYVSVTFTFTAINYNSKTATYVMDQNQNVNITLIAGTTPDQTVYITPHKVRFMCHDYAGNPIPDMAVTAIGVQTTLGSLDWIPTLFGIDLGTTPILTTLMSGTTGSDGSVVFIMLETEKYQLKYLKESQNINETRYYYPKQEEYDEIFWTEEPPRSSTVSSWELYNLSANASYMTLGLNYADTLNTTTNLTFFVMDNKSTMIYTHYYGNSPTINATYDVPVIQGYLYYWGFSARSSQYAALVNATNYIRFDDRKWKIDPMNAGAAGASAALVATAMTVYNAAAIGVIVLFGLIFGRASIKYGVVIVPLVGALFKYIGWLDTTWLLISLAVSFGVLLAFRFSEEESSS